MLKINEIFKSIQGESSYMGLPCVFVRLTGNTEAEGETHVQR